MLLKTNICSLFLLAVRAPSKRPRPLMNYSTLPQFILRYSRRTTAIEFPLYCSSCPHCINKVPFTLLHHLCFRSLRAYSPTPRTIHSSPWTLAMDFGLISGPGKTFDDMPQYFPRHLSLLYLDLLGGCVVSGKNTPRTGETTANFRSARNSETDYRRKEHILLHRQRHRPHLVSSL